MTVTTLKVNIYQIHQKCFEYGRIIHPDVMFLDELSNIFQAKMQISGDNLHLILSHKL